jgi:hypothetical protein
MTRRTESWFEHALRRTGWQPQRQVVALATLGFFIALVLGVLYLSQVASDAATYRRLTSLLDERDELERVNEQLRVEIAALKNVPHLFSRAEELGFSAVEGGQLEYLVVPGYVPEQLDTVAPMSSDEDASDQVVYDETFTDWLRRQWDALRGLVGGG